MTLVDDQETALFHEKIGMGEAVVEDLGRADDHVCPPDIQLPEPLLAIPEIDSHLAAEVLDVEFRLISDEVTLLIHEGNGRD